MSAVNACVLNAVSGKPETWRMVFNISDRWGEIDLSEPHCAEKEALANDTELLKALKDQMWEENCFIAIKGGEYGVLFESEYVSAETDADLNNKLRPFNDVVNTLQVGLKKLSKQFSSIEMGIADSQHIIDERPAVWAFVKNGQLSNAERSQLGEALNSL